MMFPGKNPALIDLTTALVSSLLVAGACTLGWTTALERPVWDLLMRLPRPGGSLDAGMAAVVIDDRSVELYGPLPWPRSRLAEVIQRTWRAGARAVVVDMLLADSDDPEGDAELATALAAGPVAAAAVLAPDGTWILPAGDLGGVAIAAHAHAEVASDGVLRMISSTKQAQGLSLPALAIVGARFSGWRGPVQPGLLLRSDFRSPPSSIVQVSAADVLMGHAKTAGVASRVVFLGVSASGAGDQFLVPVGNRRRPVPGVLAHASFASSIARGGIVSALPWWAVLAVLFAAGMTVQSWRSRAGRLHLLSLVAVLVVVPTTALVALWAGDLLVPTIAVLAAAAISVFLREALESRSAQVETDRILRSLIQNEPDHPALETGRGVQARLHLAHALQTQLIRDRNLRRTLLEGLGEGVVLWGEDGTPLLHNAAAERLWGHVPTRSEVHDAHADGVGNSGAVLEIARHGRTLEVTEGLVANGRLALIRDVSEHRELERRRRDMQRLVSHELKTPLASIAGLGEMIERYSLTGEELSRTAHMIRSEADRLGVMVKRFLELERLGADLSAHERTQVSLVSLVEDRCGVLAASADRRNVAVVVDTDGQAIINGVTQLLEELVDNLVGNALKYSAEDSQVTVEVRSGTSTATLRVVDHGPGIPAEAVDHLFERFYRVPGTSASGTGLGLALVKEVAALHHADVAVDSEVGRGSTFTVTFPLSED